jgi:lipoate-protein ligase B
MIDSQRKILFPIIFDQIDFEEFIIIQKNLAHKKTQNKNLPDFVIFASHPKTYSLGASEKQNPQQNFLIEINDILKNKSKIVQTDRGGRVTFHDPGILGIYTIFSECNNIPVFQQKLGEVIILSLKDIGIDTEYNEKSPGVRYKNYEIAAFGLRVYKPNISSFGANLLIDPDLKYFDYIKPCGDPNKKMTSIKEILGETIKREIIINTLTKYLLHVFGLTLSSA